MEAIMLHVFARGGDKFECDASGDRYNTLSGEEEAMLTPGH